MIDTGDSAEKQDNLVRESHQNSDAELLKIIVPLSDKSRVLCKNSSVEKSAELTCGWWGKSFMETEKCCRGCADDWSKFTR